MTLHFQATAARIGSWRRATKRVWFLVAARHGRARHRRAVGGAGPRQRRARPRRPTSWRLLGPHAPAVRTRHGLVVGGLRPLPRAGAPPAGRGHRGGRVAAGSAAGRTTRAWSPWLRRFHARIPTVVSICTGAFVLGGGGRCSTAVAPPRTGCILDELRARFPAARVVDEGIFVQGRRRLDLGGDHRGHRSRRWRWSRSDHGHRVAMAVARRLVLFLRRSGNQAQFSSALQRQETGAAPAARHLDLRPRARRRGAAGRADRGRGRDEPAHAQPLVPRAPRRVARRAGAPPADRRGAAAAGGDVRCRSRTSRRAPASATPARCGAPSRSASASRRPRTASASPRRRRPEDENSTPGWWTVVEPPPSSFSVSWP